MRKRFQRVMCLLIVLITVAVLPVSTLAAGKSDTLSKGLSASRCIDPDELSDRFYASLLSPVKAALMRPVLRVQFRTVAATGRALGYTTAADLLEHSLQNHPSDFIYGKDSRYARQLLNSAEGQNIVNSFKAAVAGKDLTEKKYNGSTSLSSSIDLYLSYRLIAYTVSGVRTGDRWVLTVTFNDVYDFAKQAWEHALSLDSAVTIINNYAAYAQDIQAIVPFHISITFETDFAA